MRAIPVKNTQGGKKANDIFFYGWLVLTFFKLHGSLVVEKSDYMGGGVLSENQLLTFDRYIKWKVLVSIKIWNPNLPVICKLIYFV